MSPRRRERFRCAGCLEWMTWRDDWMMTGHVCVIQASGKRKHMLAPWCPSCQRKGLHQRQNVEGATHKGCVRVMTQAEYDA